jgi:hypothetical protein
VNFKIQLIHIIIYFIIGALYSFWIHRENRIRYYDSYYMKRLTTPDFYPFGLHDALQIISVLILGPFLLLAYLTDHIWQTMPTINLFKISYKPDRNLD